MGTSQGLSTPSGGGWTGAKLAATGFINGTQGASPAGVVAATLGAMGGLGLGVRSSSSHAARGEGTPAGHGRGGHGRSQAAQARQVGRTMARLGGFATTVQERGLADALGRLDLAELEGRPAVEVIARVSERLAEGMGGVDEEMLRASLNQTLLEAAQLQEELGYRDLEGALQQFLNDQGLGGLVELFLTRFVSDLVAAALLQHIDEKTESALQTEALLDGIEIVCRAKSRSIVERYRNDGRFNRINWFGVAGNRLGRDIATSILSELRTS